MGRLTLIWDFDGGHDVVDAELAQVFGRPPVPWGAVQPGVEDRRLLGGALVVFVSAKQVFGDGAPAFSDGAELGGDGFPGGSCCNWVAKTRQRTSRRALRMGAMVAARGTFFLSGAWVLTLSVHCRGRQFVWLQVVPLWVSGCRQREGVTRHTPCVAS